MYTCIPWPMAIFRWKRYAEPKFYLVRITIIGTQKIISNLTEISVQPPYRHWGVKDCLYDILQRYQWRQGCRHDDFLAATKQLYKWYFPSVRPSVCLSVCLSHLFHHVLIIVSSWNFQELLLWSKVMSMQKVKVKGQGHRGQHPTQPYPDPNSSLNSYMAMKSCTQLKAA